MDHAFRVYCCGSYQKMHFSIGQTWKTVQHPSFAVCISFLFICHTAVRPVMTDKDRKIQSRMWSYVLRNNTNVFIWCFSWVLCHFTVALAVFFPIWFTLPWFHLILQLSVILCSAFIFLGFTVISSSALYWGACLHAEITLPLHMIRFPTMCLCFVNYLRRQSVSVVAPVVWLSPLSADPSPPGLRGQNGVEEPGRSRLMSQNGSMVVDTPLERQKIVFIRWLKMLQSSLIWKEIH